MTNEIIMRIPWQTKNNVHATAVVHTRHRSGINTSLRWKIRITAVARISDTRHQGKLFIKIFKFHGAPVKPCVYPYIKDSLSHTECWISRRRRVRKVGESLSPSAPLGWLFCLYLSTSSNACVPEAHTSNSDVCSVKFLWNQRESIHHLCSMSAVIARSKINFCHLGKAKKRRFHRYYLLWQTYDHNKNNGGTHFTARPAWGWL